MKVTLGFLEKKVLTGLEMREECFHSHAQMKISEIEIDDFSFFMFNGDMIENMESSEHPLADMEEVVHWCYNNMQKKVRAWRNMLKGKQMDPDHPNQERQTSPDPRVSNVDWRKLLEYWRSPTKVEESAKNKVSRAGPRPTHTTGAKSYSRCYHEMLEKGVISCELEAYHKFHQNKMGCYPDHYTKQKCEEIALRCTQRQVQNTTNHEFFARVLDEVFGKHNGGYERGYGGGVSR